MYISVKGVYENGQIILNEDLPTQDKVEVIVTFLPKTEEPALKKERKPGSLARLGEQEGKTYSIPDDFNEPLDDLKDYM
jgi:hypothetical protein